ncbi:MAG: NAD(P)-binding domain-containing protein [Bacteroidota bacterium]|jgi:thioredoxin reductase/Pyruvate/2-oxoacid:ferredoxin oxidoreductase delta subunit
MESLITFAIFVVLLLAIAVPYWWKVRRQAKLTRKAYEKSSRAGLTAPVTLHPRIDVLGCIGCGSCVRVCPEDVLGLVDGKAAIINGVRCIGHALCVDACPVGAITLQFGKPRRGMEIPFYDDRHQTNIDGLYIIGELGGIGLIRNALDQGVKAIEHIASRPRHDSDVSYDVAIVGAGPAGIGAALGARQHGLRHIVLEQDDIGGSILHYPRQKLVLTSPVELPLYGKLNAREIGKEELLETILSLVERFRLNIKSHCRIEMIMKESHAFRLQAKDERFSASYVILALGRRGSPRKLSVPGERLPKVFYRLIEAEAFVQKRLLVVGGGDSAIEAAVGLARQKGTTVALSYRREEFVRLKEKNEERILEMMKAGTVNVMFGSEVVEIRMDSVLVKDKDNVIQTLPNDFVFVFAGGELPAEFLAKIGVKLRTEEEELSAS